MAMNGKNILLGVSGGIGAYKTCELLRLYIKSGARVRVVMTESASKFVSPLTMQSLGAEAVTTDIFEPNQYTIEHVAWADWGNILVIAPCTANMIGKMAGGIADEVLSTQAIAFSGPILLAPAMNFKMYNNKAVRKNIQYLESSGVHFIGPETGQLATLITATGRMTEPINIYYKTRQVLVGRNDLLGKKVVVTAGPTREPLDPVRYISNHSSGKMGYSLADAAIGFGADVTLISGPTHLEPPPGVQLIKVQTASQMQSALQKYCYKTEFLFMAAAVADYRPSSYYKQKIKRTNDNLKLDLIPNPDLLKSLGENRPRVVVGFALETENLEALATEKLRAKKLDMIVANNPTEEGVEFGSEYNKVTMITRDSKVMKLERMPKFEVAVKIIDESLKLVIKRGPRVKK